MLGLHAPWNDLNENDPHEFICLTTWSPVGGTVGEGFGGVAFAGGCVTGVGFGV